LTRARAERLEFAADTAAYTVAADTQKHFASGGEWSRKDASDIDGIKPKGRNERERVSQFVQRRIDALKRKA
jgi:hypothetical protein